MWDKIKAWFGHSVTILWARIQVVAGAAAAAAFALLQDPNVVAALQSALQPKYIPITSSPSGSSPNWRGGAR